MLAGFGFARIEETKRQPGASSSGEHPLLFRLRSFLLSLFTAWIFHQPAVSYLSSQRVGLKAPSLASVLPSREADRFILSMTLRFESCARF